MRLQYLLLLAAAALLASINSSSAASLSQKVTLDSPARFNTLLRTETVDDYDEEREPTGFISKVSNMAKTSLKSVIISPITSQVQKVKARQLQKYVDGAFSTLKLDTFKLKRTIFGTRQMKAWYEAVLKVNNVNPEVYMLNTLMTHFKGKEDELSRVIQFAKKSRMAELASKMQTAQFRRWNAGTGVPKSLTDTSEVDHEIVKAFTAFL